jgi:predicted phosphoadenosine phosphosulfate sulfurtransferase
MPKERLNINVLQAAKKRIKYIFDNFDKIYLSFSAGKDSTIMLHLVLEECKIRNKKIGVLFIDLEGQYKLTINHAKECFEMYKNYIDLYWVCLPIHLRNAVSNFEPFWKCWDNDKKNDWIRQPPKEAITNLNYFPFFTDGMEFEEFAPLFGEWYANNEKCAAFIGIRTDESLNRYRTISSKSKEKYKNNNWTTKITEHCYNVYPIYDWSTEDIWIYHAKYPNKRHNELYDIMYKAGLSIHQQRICQPYGDDQRRGLWLFHLIEPETWCKIVSRVNGANSGALYVQDTGNITGYGTITLPPNHTWESFSRMILNTLPETTKEHYLNKIFTYIKWWSKRGYPNNIPDSAPKVLEAKKKVPSWRRICKTLLRNDFWCKGLSFTQHKTKAYKKYLELKKRQRQQAKFFNYD